MNPMPPFLIPLLAIPFAGSPGVAIAFVLSAQAASFDYETTMKCWVASFMMLVGQIVLRRALPLGKDS